MKSEIKGISENNNSWSFLLKINQFCFVLKTLQGVFSQEVWNQDRRGLISLIWSLPLSHQQDFWSCPRGIFQSGPESSTISLDQETSQEDFITRSKNKIFWSSFRGTELQPPVPDNTNYHFVHPANLLRQHPTPGLPVSSFFPDLLPSLLSLISKWIKVMKWQLTQRQLCSQ